MAISDAMRLRVYNDALLILGERRLSSVTEAREPRRVLDDIWDNGGAVLLALESGDWNFAMRTQAVAYDPGIEPAFGFRRAIPKPADLRRLVGLAADPYFAQPFTGRDYVEEASHWFTERDAVYVRYVSDDDAYGMDGAKWTEHFVKYLGAYHAAEACERITNSATKVQRAEAKMKESLRNARGRDAMDRGSQFPPVGSWVRARLATIAGRERN